MRTLLAILLVPGCVALAAAQGTPNLFQQLLGQSQGQTGQNAQLVAHLKQRPELEFLVANQNINFFLVRKSVVTTPELSKAVVAGIYPNPVVRGGQTFVGSAIELQVRCASRDYRPVKEVALNAQLNPIDGVIAAKPVGNFMALPATGAAHEVALRLCGGATSNAGALAQAPATPQQPGPLAGKKPQITPFGEVPLEVELAIGRQLAGDLLGAARLAKDGNLQAYVNHVGRWIASHSERADLKWYFGVLDTQDINAFALPGGYVFVTEGLVKMLTSEAELAGVLAHEIGHVLMKHHIKLLQQSQLVNAFAGLATQRVARDQSLRSAAIRNLLGNGAQILARGLDKDAEMEADRIGVVLATRAGYYPYGLPTVLQMLDGKNPADGTVALLFKTHPPADERLAALGDAMGAGFDQYAQGKELRERFASTAPWPVAVAAAAAAAAPTPAPAPQAKPAARRVPSEPAPVAREEDSNAEEPAPAADPAPAQAQQAEAQKPKEPTLASSLRDAGKSVRGFFSNAFGGGGTQAGASSGARAASLAPGGERGASPGGTAEDAADLFRRLEGRWKGESSQGGGFEWIVGPDGRYQSVHQESGRTVRRAGTLVLDGDGSIHWKGEPGQEGTLVVDDEADPLVLRGSATATGITFEATQVPR